MSLENVKRHIFTLQTECFEVKGRQATNDA